MKSVKALIKSSDMNESLQFKVVDLFALGVEKFDQEREIAAYVKKTLDSIEGGVWQCILGKNFGCYVSHMDGYFCYFEIGSKSSVVYRTK